ncbi:hypothetical protein ABG067_006887 [Albugo candida]|uniref:NADH dehydrogenase [ubiquinone] 1 alpha subcomplex subunit 12 n=1 Tax=Albugo candida TaxID=65357 RepID=A0A024GVI8_9STRA|nr:unnamed protein product [Albugo candida]|eukprot:CCI50648.1 unnamed protein product [Albugo candida]
MGDVKFGYCVGTDRLGNKYYEDPTEVAGQQRYCEYHIDSFDNFDGDQIPPEWHAWLHYTTDAKPGDEAFKAENWAKVPISQKTDTPFEHHVGPTDCFVPHATLKRTRGYNSEHFMLKAGEPDQYYMQPNHPLRCRKRSNQIFEHVDYNEPKKSFENASGPLRDASLN